MLLHGQEKLVQTKNNENIQGVFEKKSGKSQDQFLKNIRFFQFNFTKFIIFENL